MIGGLVEHQHIDARIDQLRQRQSALLAAGKIANMFVNIIAGKMKFSQKGTQFAGGRRLPERRGAVP